MDTPKSPNKHVPVTGSAGEIGNSDALKQLCEKVSDYLCILDSNRRFLWVNRLHPSLSAEDVIGKQADAFLSPEARKIFVANFEKVQATGEPATYAVTNQFLGEKSWLEHQLISVKGDPDRFLLITREVTDIRHAKLASEESELLAQNLIEYFPDIILVMKPDGVVLATNEMTARSLGSSREQLIGNVAWANMPPAVRERREQYAAEVCQSKLPVRRTDENGGLIFDSVGYPLLQENGQVKAIAVISKDVTQQRRAEEMLHQKHARQSHSEKMEGLGALAAGISHDFNNLLTPILINTERAGREDCPPERRAVLLASVMQAAERASKLVKQILVFGDGTKSDICRTDLSAAIRETLSFVRSTLASNISIEVSLPKEPLWASVDLVQFNQAIINLCINAGHAMAPAGGALHIEMDVHDSPASLPAGLSPTSHFCVRVTDSGPGIEESVLPLIFDPFYSTKPPDQGSGLGLFVVHSVATNHRGAITVDSVSGEGTSFSLWLPCSAATKTQEVDRAEQARAAKFSGARILLLEDDELVSEAVTAIMSEDDHIVTRYATCSAAWEGFQKADASYDIAVVDRRLGDGSGLEVALLMRSLRPGFPIILSSGHIDAEVRRVCETNGLAVLPKPYQPIELLNVIDETLSQAARS